MAAVKELYTQLQSQWLTPSEVLAPYYAQAGVQPGCSLW